MIRNGSFPWPRSGAAVTGCRSQSSKESFRGILLLAVDSNEDFVQVPNIAKAALTPLQFSGIVKTELPTPDSNRFIRDDDSPFREKILDVSEAQLMISGGKR